LSRCLRWRRRRRSPFHHSEEVEAISSLSFSDWSSLDEDSERNLEDDEDAATKTSEDSHLEWREEAERKAEEEEDEMLEGKEAMLESFATTRKEERTRAAQDVRAESSPRGHGRVLARPQFHIARFTGLRAFGRLLRRGARHLRTTHHAPRMVKALPPPPSSSSPRMRRSDFLRVALII
jgi:hypothetical protein